nr:hypothetical protein [Desulfobacteraceae bacterium]
MTGALPKKGPLEAVRPALADIGAVKIPVRQIRFSGAADLVPETELQALVRDGVGTDLDFTGLQGLASKVTAYLRSRGWPLARAYLPRQDVTAGRIEIAILEGKLESGGGGWRIALAEGARLAPGRLAAMAEAAAPSGGEVRQEKLERALLLMNDLPGLHASARLERGSENGTTRAVVDAREGPLLTGSVWADNYGNDSTGQAQASTILSLNDPCGYGDQVNLSATASGGLQLARLGYDFPLGARGLRAGLGATLLRYEVVEGSGEAAGFDGQSWILLAGLAYPIVRTRALNLKGVLDFGHKALRDDSRAGPLRDRRIDAFTLALQGNRLDPWGGGGLTGGSVGLTYGDLDLSRVLADEAADAATLRTQGRYSKINLNLSRLQQLPARFTLLGRFSAQWTQQNLDSSEQFFLGGPLGLRAYPLGEGQGDEGWLAGLDFGYDVPGGTPWGDLQLSAFLDTGRIRLHHDAGSLTIATATGQNTYGLSGAGLGLDLGQPGSHALH